LGYITANIAVAVYIVKVINVPRYNDVNIAIQTVKLTQWSSKLDLYTNVFSYNTA